MGNIVKQMKEAIEKSGSSKKDILFFSSDTAHRIRFLQELDDGYSFQFHNDFNAGINELCKDPEDHEDCPLCKDGVRIRQQFLWSVWDYDSNSVKLVSFRATGVTPVPTLIEYYENYGTIMDRDYKLKKIGKGMGGSFVVTPLDKEKFKNAKAKAYTEKQVKEILEEAYKPADEVTKDTDDDEDEKPVKKDDKKGKKAKKEPTLREKYEELEMDDLKSICSELGMSKKEIKAFDDEEEILDELFDNYEEDDLQELYDNLDSDDDEDDE